MESTRLSFRVPAARRDELIAELWALGTRGVEELGGADGDRLEAYFDPASLPAPEEHADTWRRCGATLVEVRPIAAEDWLAAYRARSLPLTIGPLVIDPREPETGAAPLGPEVLRIPARNAFGTGSHESTRLMLEMLCATTLSGRSVLDVGTGSGILALAALRRGARRAVAFDLDVGSVVTAGDNARLNGLAPELFAGTVAALRGTFDVVLVNILPHRWLGDAAAVAACLRADGELLASGLLAAEEDEVVAPLVGLGLSPTGRREDGEWAALSFGRP
jgi:ribosomal protein L11 methyltransferase